MSTIKEDQRREPRLSVSEQVLVAVDGRPICTCEMIDFNGKGARLKLPAQDVPDRFCVIDLAGGIAYSARAVWRDPPMVGAALLHARLVEDADTPEWMARLWREARLANGHPIAVNA